MIGTPPCGSGLSTGRKSDKCSLAHSLGRPLYINSSKRRAVCPPRSPLSGTRSSLLCLCNKKEKLDDNQCNKCMLISPFPLFGCSYYVGLVQFSGVDQNINKETSPVRYCRLGPSSCPFILRTGERGGGTVLGPVVRRRQNDFQCLEDLSFFLVKKSTNVFASPCTRIITR